MSKSPPSMQQLSLSRPQHDPASVMPDVCMGLLCPKHGVCQRYENVNGSDPEGARMNSCGTGNDRPAFVQLVPRVSRR